MLNLSLSGCGFLGIYHVGVISAFREHADEILKEKISGCSAGALVAACAMCDCCLGQMVSDVLEIALKARSYALGPLHPSFSIVEILRNGLRRILPVDAHKICSGRVHVSLTRWRDGKNFLVNQFESREDLIQALICSSFVPAYSGLVPPKFRGTYFWDGGLSNNNPVLDQDTIIVSPFGGEADICPRDESASYFCHDFQGTNLQWSYENIYRISKALFPPNPEVLKAICFRGYKDAISFLKSRNLLQCSCNRSWEKTSINSMFGEHLNGFENVSLINEAAEADMMVDDASDVYDSEEDNLLQYANNQPLAYQEMPASVCAILDAACNDSQGLFNFIYDSQLTRAISIMILPWTLPIEFCMNFTRKVLELVPKFNVPANPSLFHTLLVFFNYVIQRFKYDRYQYHARVTCKLCHVNSIGGKCCHSNAAAVAAAAAAAAAAVVAVNAPKVTISNMSGDVVATNAIVNGKSITSGTPSSTSQVATGGGGVPSGANLSAVAAYNYMSAGSSAASYYYPKMCARHRVPSICSSETTGVASGSMTSLSASNRLQQHHHRRRRHHQPSSRRSISGAASNASDMASSVDLNEYKSSKLAARRRSSRHIAYAALSSSNSGGGIVVATQQPNINSNSIAYLHNHTNNTNSTTYASSSSYYRSHPYDMGGLSNNSSSVNSSGAFGPNSSAYLQLISSSAHSTQLNNTNTVADNTNTSTIGILTSTLNNRSEPDYKRMHIKTLEKMHSAVVVSSDVNAKASNINNTNKNNLLLNSTPMSTPQTPIAGHKVHFHLNYTTDEEENMDTKEEEEEAVMEEKCESTTTNPNLVSSAPKPIVKNTNHNNNVNNVVDPTSINNINNTNKKTATTNNGSSDVMQIEWESYWDTLEYNCLGRINLDL